MSRAPATRPAGETKPELVIGLVGAVGTDLAAAVDAVETSIGRYGYEAVEVRVSELMHALTGGEHLESLEHEDERITGHMDAGDQIRQQTGRNDAIVGLVAGSLSDYRAAHFKRGAVNTAFIVNSLKHPAEIDALRQIYRDRFIAISVHSPTDSRRESLQSKIASSRDCPERADTFQQAAEAIMQRDEHDDDHGFGQNVREAFVKGYFYASTESASELAAGIDRYFRLFFGYPFDTPTQDEFVMFQAHTAALRSADLSRQVGAAICSQEGEIVAMGCNEVPKANGGQYWPEDEPDKRDFQLGYDSNVRYRDAALTEAFEHLKAGGLLTDESEIQAFMAALQGTRLANITEFGRPVHAEMAALLTAARMGTPVAGARMFTTTFPCHNCARHIIDAGIKEVVYREPYAKSMASDLHRDAIVVDSTTDPGDKVRFRRFVGVGPPQYFGLFTMQKRKDANGQKIKWTEQRAVPHLITTETAYLTNEDDYLGKIAEKIDSVVLARR